jgi:hypothetical protein
MKKQWLMVSLVLGSLLLHACGGGSGPVATRISVTATGGTATAGTAFMITVSVLDGSGAVFTKFMGTVHLASSDAQAVLPPDATLTNGTGTFSVTLATGGSQTITGTSGRLSGTSSPITVSPGAATQLSITAVNGTSAVFQYHREGAGCLQQCGDQLFRNSSSHQLGQPGDAARKLDADKRHRDSFRNFENRRQRQPNDYRDGHGYRFHYRHFQSNRSQPRPANGCLPTSTWRRDDRADLSDHRECNRRLRQRGWKLRRNGALHKY